MMVIKIGAVYETELRYVRRVLAEADGGR